MERSGEEVGRDKKQSFDVSELKVGENVQSM